MIMILEVLNILTNYILTTNVSINQILLNIIINNYNQLSLHTITGAQVVETLMDKGIVAEKRVSFASDRGRGCLGRCGLLSVALRHY